MKDSRKRTVHLGERFKIVALTAHGQTWYSIVRLSDNSEIANVSYDGAMGIRHPFALDADEMIEIAALLAKMRIKKKKVKKLVECKYDTNLNDPGTLSIKVIRAALNRIAKDNDGEETLLQFDAGHNNISCCVMKEIEVDA